MTGAAPRRVLFLTASARKGGNTEMLAQRAASGLGPAGQREWQDLAYPTLPPYTDRRPAGRAPRGRLAALAQAVLAADDLVLAAPVYWYALPAPAKLFLDHWTSWLDAPQTGFAEGLRGKRLWLITVRADPDPSAAAPVEAAMMQTARFLAMDWRGALHGIGDAPGDVARDAKAWGAAPRFLELGGA